MIACSLYGQNDRYLYVYPNAPEAYPSVNLTTNQPTSDAQINQLFSDFGVTVYGQSFPGADASSIISNAYEIYLDGNIEQFATALWETEKFDIIHDVYFYVPASCDDPVYVNDPEFVEHYNDPIAADERMWHLESIEAECAWSVTTGNPSITIGVVDTEFDATHPDLAANLVYWEPGIHSEGPHGTGVSGSAAAVTNNGNQISGIGYNTTIAGYRVGFDNPNENVTGQGVWIKVWQAFLDGRPVINVSWISIRTGTIFFNDIISPFITTQEEAARYITENGTVLTLGGGNRPGHVSPIFPFFPHGRYANIPGVINVGWLERGNILKEQLDDNGDIYTPYSEFIDLVAPSGFVRVLNPNGELGWAWGTSHGAPMVAGTAALMLDVNDCITPAEIEGILKNTAAPVSNGSFAPHGTGRLLASAAVRLAAGYKTYVDETRVWNDPMHLSGDLVVTDGNQLTIKSQVRIEKDVKIIVEPNARLVIDGGILTTGCSGEKWEGIIVQGNQDESQDYNYYSGRREQGYLRLTNGAVIEHAVFGVRMYDPEGGNASRGGLIVGTNSTIRNCIYGVDFAPYQNFNFISGSPKANASRFTNCTFTTDDNMIIDPVNFKTHVSMRGVNGLKFNGCQFSNNQAPNSDTPLEKRGQGIRALDAGFSVLALCTGISTPSDPCVYQHSEFTGFATGVLAGNKGGINTFTVDRADFQDNHFGIAGYASDNCSITRNRFSVGWTMEPQNNPYVGVLVNGSSAFKIEENEFAGSANVVSGGRPVGLVVRNSGNDINQVYKNTYNSLYVGNLANGDNKGLNDIDGLVYFCNENETTSGGNNDYDFSVPSSSFLDSGIANQQGAENFPAGNVFSMTTNNDETHFQNQLEDVAYFYYSSGLNEEPIAYTNSTFAANQTPFNNECSTRLPNGTDKEFTNDDDRNDAIDKRDTELDTKEGKYAFGRLMRELKTDSTNYDYVAIRAMFNQKGDYEALCDVVDCHLQEKSYTQAMTALDNIEIDLTLTTEETARYNNFRSLKKMQIDAGTSNLDLEIFISDNYTDLVTISETKYGVAATQAHYLLGIAELERRGTFVHPRIILPGERSDERAEKIFADIQFSVAPNPAKDYLQFSFNLQENTTLNIYDISGTVQHSVVLSKDARMHQVNLENYPSGIYFYSVLTANRKVEKGKIIVLK